MFNDEPKKVYQQHIRTDVPEKTQEETTSSSPQPQDKPKKVQPLKQIASLIVVALFAGASFYLAQRVTTPVHNAEKSSAAGLNTVKMMEIYYIPPNTEFSNRQLDVFNKSLATKVYIENASAYHGDMTKQMITFNSTTQYIRNEFRPFDANSDYRTVLISILNDKKSGPSACELIEQQKLDQVWVWFDDNADKAPGREWMINNVTSNYGNTDIGRDTTICPNTTRTFSVFGLAYNRFATNAVHSYGHFMEGLITGIEGFDMFVGRFEGVQSKEGRNGAPIDPYKLTEKCGRVHVPPNVPFDTANNQYPGYTYHLTNMVDSTCANWTPDGTGPKTPVGLDTWFNNPIPSTSQDGELKTFNIDPFYTLDELHFLTWWMQQFPHESSGVAFQGKRLPSWWALSANTDEVINLYLGMGYWFKPDLIPPVAANSTASCSATSGATSNCTYTPGSNVLGAHDENQNVLGVSTYGNLALVSVHYTGSLANPSLKVNSVTFCGDPMTNVTTGKTQIGTPQTGDGMRTELWYKVLPKSGVCPVVTTFSADPGQRVVSTTIFNNIDTVLPIAGTAYAITMSDPIAQPPSNTPSNMNMSLSGPKDSLIICGFSIFPGLATPPGNTATPFNGTMSLWQFQQPKIGTATANVWGEIGTYKQRTVDNSFDGVFWQTTKTTKWAGLCTNLNVKPFSVPPVSPTPIPPTATPTISPSVPPTASPTTKPTVPPTVSPTPTPIAVVPPVVDIKAGGLDRFFAGISATKTLSTTVTLTWKSTGATSCKALGNWTGAKVLNGSATVSIPTTAKTLYVLQCTGTTGTGYDQVYIYPASATSKFSTTFLGKMFVNGFDDTTFPVGSGISIPQTKRTIPKGTSPTFTWVTNAGTCFTTWTVPIAGTGTYVMAPISVDTTYSLTCTVGASASATPYQISATAYVR